MRRNKLIVFTRVPESGRNKTRLIPALGAEGAARFHDRLARHAIGRASAFSLCSPGTDLEIRVTGGSTVNCRAWLGGGDCRIQGGGSLGERLARASDEAFDRNTENVVLIGTDCPRLDEARLQQAFDALDHSDVAIGPALDGGYYLVGLKEPHPELFEGISWGGPDVFSQTMDRISGLRLSSTVLEGLPDVDHPVDLAEGEGALSEGRKVSVILPSLNEAELLERTLAQVFQANPWEVLVADGGSSDATREIAERSGALVMEGAKGRAAQMNLAAASATGEFLFFLHADTLPPASYDKIIAEILCRPGVSAGAFRLGVDAEIGAASLIERMVDLRCRWFGSPYGDQGLFVRRSLFEKLGGFPDCPAMEDLIFARSLKRAGTLVVANERVSTSGRRWRDRGLIQTFLRHQLMLAAYYLGLSPGMISRIR